MQEFLYGMSGIVSHMKTYGESVRREIFASKVLRSLTKDFDYVVAIIEESNNFSKYIFDELMSSLQADEARLSKAHEKFE